MESVLRDIKNRNPIPYSRSGFYMSDSIKYFPVSIFARTEY
ncbi:hypothetical protein C4K28_4120 [Pseudomonas chlororaphis subsp. piscium]|nr:hypothetical protein C4K33_4051 [Pseudomonas chlororaphis subsp. piscium]AZC96840.1 hypothetical protein C4K28_4120 [Pseudomonas chlororaphis subsp. piscium]